MVGFGRIRSDSVGYGRILIFGKFCQLGRALSDSVGFSRIRWDSVGFGQIRSVSVGVAPGRGPTKSAILTKINSKGSTMKIKIEVQPKINTKQR